MLSMDLWLIFFTVVVTIGNCFAQTDRTLESEATGKDVTDAASDKVKKIFGDDHRFLIRTAWVESRFGKSPQTFRRGYFGGIWQVDKVGFLDTQNIMSHTSLKNKHKLINDTIGINWMSVKWEDLRKPLYSALAARLLMLNDNKPIPTNVEDQADYWKTYYNSDAGKGSKEKFINDVRLLESCKSSKSKCRMDLIIVLDGSGSIGFPDFAKAREFVNDLVKCISSRYTRIGLLVYSSAANVIVPLNNNLTETEFQATILGIGYPTGGTATALAIDEAVNLLQQANSGNSSLSTTFPKIMIVLTDGQSDSPDYTSKSAIHASESGIIAYAIGIGAGYNLLELGKIAGSNDNQIFTISSYGHLTDLLYQTRTQTCSKPVRPRRHTAIEDFVHQYEISYYAFNLPRDGITFSLNVTEGDALGYYSYTVENPTAALNDGVIMKGQTYIPLPTFNTPIFPVKVNDTQSKKLRTKRMSSESISALIQNDIHNVQSENEIEDAQYGQVFVAIEGVNAMNNFTIYTEDGGVYSGSSTIFRIINELLVFCSSFFILFVNREITNE